MSRYKSLADFPSPYRHTLAYWSALRRIGFDAGDIFVGFDEVSGVPDTLFVQLDTQGKQFIAMVARVPGASREAVFAIWKRAASMFNDATDDERDACFRESMMGNLDFFVTFTQAIMEHGIVIPNEHILRATSLGQA